MAGSALCWLCAVQNGKTKFSVENATKTRVVLADTRIHILGSYQNIRVCRYHLPFQLSLLCLSMAWGLSLVQSACCRIFKCSCENGGCGGSHYSDAER